MRSKEERSHTIGSAVELGLLLCRPPFLHSPLVAQLKLKLKGFPLPHAGRVSVR